MTKAEHEQIVNLLKGVKLDISPIRSNAYKGGKEEIGLIVKIPAGAKYRVDFITLPPVPKVEPAPKVEPQPEKKIKGKKFYDVERKTN